MIGSYIYVMRHVYSSYFQKTLAVVFCELKDMFAFTWLFTSVFCALGNKCFFWACDVYVRQGCTYLKLTHQWGRVTLLFPLKVAEEKQRKKYHKIIRMWYNMCPKFKQMLPIFKRKYVKKNIFSSEIHENKTMISQILKCNLNEGRLYTQVFWIKISIAIYTYSLKLHFFVNSTNYKASYVRSWHINQVFPTKI